MDYERDEKTGRIESGPRDDFVHVQCLTTKLRYTRRVSNNCGAWLIVRSWR